MLPQGCEQDNTEIVVDMPAGENTASPQAATENDAGFAISINGTPVDADPRVQDRARRVDVALAAADVRVSFDGLGVVPRLDLEILGQPAALQTGDRITVQSALNYPAFVARGEMRVIDMAAIGGPRLVQVLPVEPNGQVALTIPDGRDLVVVHRVYDTAGRYDETAPVSLSAPDDRYRVDGVEDGADSTVRRRIPVQGGAVTVSGRSVSAGATVLTLGERVRPDPDGSFVLQRILPAGDYGVAVQVEGGGQDLSIIRDIKIPRSEWFYVAVADLTYGLRNTDSDRSRSYTNGRLAFYVDGKTQSGVQITASADTGEGEIADVFRRLNDRDGRSVLSRVDPRDLFPTYGDDSTIEDRTPTSGAFFLRVERDGNYLQFGDFRADLSGNALLRNERTLYGLVGHIASQEQTSAGEARAQTTVYAALPDMVPGRDVFLGTGGSVYFLSRQDIGRATETLTVQIRDRVTGRVIETRTLQAGTDYTINYIQGYVTLTRPLQSSTGTGLITNGSRSDLDVQLIAQYEYTPDAGDVDGASYGGRAEVWATDTLRFGVTAQSEQTDTADQIAVSADVLLQYSEQTYARLDIARTEGPGFGSTFSADGGLVVDPISTVGGDGTAARLEMRADLGDLGLPVDGAIGGYFESRDQGFSTLDFQVTSDTRLWGVFADVAASDRLRFSAYYDAFETDAGDVKNTGGAELTYEVSDRVTLALGIENQDKTTTDLTQPDGSRTDVAARVTYAVSDRASVYLLGQNSVAFSGLPRNDRFGIGGTYAFANGWAAEGEISDGSLGIGGRAVLSYSDGAGNTRYAGYELDPGRTVPGVTLDGRDQGRLVVGGRQALSKTVDIFSENIYDVFGRNQTLTNAYGVEYTPYENLRYAVSYEQGTVEDGFDNDFDRKAISFGVEFDDEVRSAAARLEYRTEDGLRSGSPLDTDTILISGRAAYKIDDAQRLTFSAKLARTKTTDSSILDGDIADVIVGYALRPVIDERLNILISYRYLFDDVGQRHDDVDERGPRQRSHIGNLALSYDLNPQWTLGGKIGFRLSESAADDASPFVQNDAWLAIANARYHLVHDWDALIEVRALGTIQSDTRDFGVLGAVYKQVGNNTQIGIGYNFGSFSDNLADQTEDDRGAFVNLVAKF